MTVTQIVLTKEQFDKAVRIKNFSTKLCAAMIENLDSFASLRSTEEYRGSTQHDVTFERKSISLDAGLREKLFKKSINMSNYARWLMDNKEEAFPQF